MGCPGPLQGLDSPELESMDAMLTSPAHSSEGARPPLNNISSSGGSMSQDGSSLDVLDVLAPDTPGLPFFSVIIVSLSAAVEPHIPVIGSHADIAS